MKPWQIILATTATVATAYFIYSIRQSTTSTTSTTSTPSDTTISKTKKNSKKKSPSPSRKKKRKKKKGFKAGFLNGLNGLDSPSKPKRKTTANATKTKTAIKQSPEELEVEAINDFIQTSKSMQNIMNHNISDVDKQSALHMLQRRRQAIVAGLHNINGTASVAKLEQALSTMNPPAPPPEPKELYNQSIAHRIMVDPKFTMTKKKKTGLEKEIDSTVRSAYWDSLRFKLSQNKGTVTAEVISSLIREVCTAIVDIRGDQSDVGTNNFRTNVAKALSDSIDIDFLQEQCVSKQLTLNTLTTIVHAIMKVLHDCQSPERDASSKLFLTEVTKRLTLPGTLKQLKK